MERFLNLRQPHFYHPRLMGCPSPKLIPVQRESEVDIAAHRDC